MNVTSTPQTGFRGACALVGLLLFASPNVSRAQSFEETWKEFLDNNKIVNMSVLTRPDKVRDKPAYAQYLLMNMNSSFCQSDVPKAEDLLEEIVALGTPVHEAIPGFIPKLKDLQLKTKAYYRVDTLWGQFLRTRVPPVAALERVESASTSCEKETLAKYSYMMMYEQYCAGDVDAAKDIFENRTLRLAEKTSWRFDNVKGMAPEVEKMKLLFQAVPKLNRAWQTYVETGASPGFETELPVVLCNPTPNYKEYILRGVANPCGDGAAMLAKVRKLQSDSGIDFDGEIDAKLDELTELVAEDAENLAALDAAWEAFLPASRVDNNLRYGYDYCSTEPLIRAYILDGYTFVCEMADEAMRNIDSLQKVKKIKLDPATKAKIKELSEAKEQYQFNGSRIEIVWDEFITLGDTLLDDYISTDQYCDYIQEVKDWTIRGLIGDCDAANTNLEKIEAFNRKFDFKFYEELECRVQKLRIRVWECRHSVLRELATLEADQSSYEQRLEELMLEYKMEARPEVCAPTQGE